MHNYCSLVTIYIDQPPIIWQSSTEMVKYDLSLIAKVTEVKLEGKLANFRQKYQYTIKYRSLETTYID